jgi:putative restriction endonuclease
MTKAIFTTKVTPSYKDLPEDRYHFPRTYLNYVRQTVGDYIVYYEPRRSSAELSSRGGRQSYFGVARVVSVIDDTDLPDHYFAIIDRTTYLDFDTPVPFQESGQYYESALAKDERTANEIALPGFSEPPASFERPIVEMIVSRPFRERSFMHNVRAAYSNRCAMTGLRLINGGGRPEVQAAHIQPVALKGSDSVRNGVALSGTVHWMFDRGLISIGDDYKILVATNHVPEDAARLLNQNGSINLPEDETLYPNAHYLKFHRDKVFKG